MPKAKIDRVAKMIKFPLPLVKEIEDYQIKNNISSFAGAVYELCRIGLKQDLVQKKR